MIEQWYTMRQMYTDIFSPGINNFMQGFSREFVANFFTQILCGGL